MLQHLFIFTAWRGWSTISSSVRNLGKQEASRSMKFSCRPRCCCPMHGSLESSSWAGELMAAGCCGGRRNELDAEGMKDTWGIEELVAKWIVTPAMPCSSDFLQYWTSEGKFTEPHRFCTSPGFSCLRVCLSKKWHCSRMTPSPSARMGQSFQPWCRFMASLRMHSHSKWVFWGVEAEKDIPRQLDARVFQYPLIQALISKLQKH